MLELFELRILRPVILLTAALTFTLVLSTCAGDSPASPSPAAPGLSSHIVRDSNDILRGLLMDFREGYLDGVSIPAVRLAAATGDIAFAPVLVELSFFAFRDEEIAALGVALHTLTGEEIAGDDYFAWYAWLGRNKDVEPPDGYAQWKGTLFSAFDARFQNYFPAGVKSAIPLAAVQWGGVQKDGIPPLENPEFIPAGQAVYLELDEQVFGVYVNGEARAYPLRIMNSHELVNDVVGGQPVSLVYCTLCRSGILWDPIVNGEPTTFGTSGFLYQSNKLMYDRQTETLWETMTGRPVVGSLVGEHERLELLPLTLTTWADWWDAHPDTKVLSLEQGFNRRYAHPDDPAAIYYSYFNSPDLMFPAFDVKSGPQPKERVFGLRVGDEAKAYRIEDVALQGVINDSLGEQDVVVTGDAEAGAARAYLREGHTFETGTEPRTLLDEAGRPWSVTEDALVPPADSGLQAMPRLPAHEAFWFGWNSFFPDSALYQSPP